MSYFCQEKKMKPVLEHYSDGSSGGKSDVKRLNQTHRRMPEGKQVTLLYRTTSVTSPLRDQSVHQHSSHSTITCFHRLVWTTSALTYRIHGHSHEYTHLPSIKAPQFIHKANTNPLIFLPSLKMQGFQRPHTDHTYPRRKGRVYVSV